MDERCIFLLQKKTRDHGALPFLQKEKHCFLRRGWIYKFWKTWLWVGFFILPFVGECITWFPFLNESVSLFIPFLGNTLATRDVLDILCCLYSHIEKEGKLVMYFSFFNLLINLKNFFYKFYAESGRTSFHVCPFISLRINMQRKYLVCEWRVNEKKILKLFLFFSIADRDPKLPPKYTMLKSSLKCAKIHLHFLGSPQFDWIRFM